MNKGEEMTEQYLLGLLGISENDIDRYRDCYLNEHNEIEIRTRTGGNNRDSSSNEALIENEHYIRDEDADYDNTYALYYFRFPE